MKEVLIVHLSTTTIPTGGRVVRSIAEAVRALEASRPPAVVVCSHGSTTEILGAIRKIQAASDAPLVVFGDSLDAGLVRETLLAGASDFLDVSDLEPSTMALAVECAIARQVQQEAAFQTLLQQHQAELDSDRVRLRGALVNQLADRLNNPLTVIQLQSRILRGKIDPTQLKHIDAMDTAAKRLRNIVDQIGLAFQGQTGRIDIDVVSADIRPLLMRLIHERNSAAIRGITIALTGEHVISHCDLGLLDRILTYILDQAIRLSPDHGTITVDLRADERFGQVNVGMPRALTPGEGLMLFDAFSGTDDPDRSRDVGMELYVARLIARHLGGDVTLACDEGGSTITLRLHLAEDLMDAKATICLLGDAETRDWGRDSLRGRMPDTKIVAADSIAQVTLATPTPPQYVIANEHHMERAQATWPDAQFYPLTTATDWADIAAQIRRELAEAPWEPLSYEESPSEA